MGLLAMTVVVTRVRRKSLPLLREVAKIGTSEPIFDGGRENYPSVSLFG